MAVSDTQLLYLRNAREAARRGRFKEAVDALLSVIRDRDIKSGKEEIHPEWGEIWGKSREQVIGLLSPSMSKEIERAVQPSEMVEESLWKLRLGEEQRIAILLGAGSSKPPPSNIPVVSELLPQLWKRAAKLDREDLNALSRWCEDNAITDIEDLLTAAYIAHFSTKSRGVLGLLDYFLFHRQEHEPPTYRYTEAGKAFSVYSRGARTAVPQSNVAAVALLQDTLQTLFTLLMEPMISAQPNAGHKAIVDLALEHRNMTIVTTNYDGCIDQALEEADIAFDYFHSAVHPETSPSTQLLKMHGSINWAYCDSCQEMKRYNLKTVRDSYEADSLGYPIIGLCKNCRGQRRPMIVPPMSFKFLMFPPLTGLWDMARHAFNQSDIILVVGYSFSEADPHIIKMINRALSSDSKKKLIIVDTDRTLVDRVRTKLIAIFDNFDTNRVIRAAESCEELLPKLCQSLLGKPIASKPTKMKRTTKKAK